MTNQIPISRRQLLSTAAGGFGAIALAGMWSEVQATDIDPLAARAGALSAESGSRDLHLFDRGRFACRYIQSPATANNGSWQIGHRFSLAQQVRRL